MAQQAADALDHLSTLLQLKQKTDLSNRLHQRAEEMRYLPDLGDEETETDAEQRSVDEAAFERRKWEKYGLQLQAVDEDTSCDSTEAMLHIADMHAVRGHMPQAIRVVEKALEHEEKRCGQLDARLIPLLMRYASYVESDGRYYEAQAIRQRATELGELGILPPSLRMPKAPGTNGPSPRKDARSSGKEKPVQR